MLDFDHNCIIFNGFEKKFKLKDNSYSFIRKRVSKFSKVIKYVISNLITCTCTWNTCNVNAHSINRML